MVYRQGRLIPEGPARCCKAKADLYVSTGDMAQSGAVREIGIGGPADFVERAPIQHHAGTNEALDGVGPISLVLRCEQPSMTCQVCRWSSTPDRPNLTSEPASVWQEGSEPDRTGDPIACYDAIVIDEGDPGRIASVHAGLAGRGEALSRLNDAPEPRNSRLSHMSLDHLGCAVAAVIVDDSHAPVAVGLLLPGKRAQASIKISGSIVRTDDNFEDHCGSLQ